MGHPKSSRKKYETPIRPWEEDRIDREDTLVNKYGLKNKKEVWKAETALRKYREQARMLLAKIDSPDPQVRKEADKLLNHLQRMKLLSGDSSLDDVLALNLEALLSRRLQTLVYLKGMSRTPDQARQFITHGHVSVAGRRVTIPGYMVEAEEEDKISYTGNSPLQDPAHPVRPNVEFETKMAPSTSSKKGETSKKKTEEKKEDVEKPGKKEVKKEEKTEEKKEEKETKESEDATKGSKKTGGSTKEKEQKDTEEKKPAESTKQEQSAKENANKKTEDSDKETSK